LLARRRIAIWRSLIGTNHRSIRQPERENDAIPQKLPADYLRRRSAFIHEVNVLRPDADLNITAPCLIRNIARHALAANGHGPVWRRMNNLPPHPVHFANERRHIRRSRPTINLLRRSYLLQAALMKNPNAMTKS